MIDILAFLIVSILVLVLFFNMFVFDQNVFNVLTVLIGLIPIFGPLVLIIGIVALSLNISYATEFDYDTRYNDKRPFAYLQNTKFTHWLFNKCPEYCFINKSKTENDKH